ncbi:uncharacterized protein J7T54_002685 [Emericellopsis cladophorae]|uniref:Uncharacterized protein n=1 Tax=Emericellopsis cladophorae TaxID=2686198 RepID=A0A9Q0BB31_9HYPO|nr:uncharacterized protein J7T54_002685 [Emericellopsis cladophorae]KAI6777619.1 hypothetical protein J7T54_002685 [Emericellopsis cladophorae]
MARGNGRRGRGRGRGQSSTNHDPRTPEPDTAVQTTSTNDKPRPAGRKRHRAEDDLEQTIIGSHRVVWVTRPKYVPTDSGTADFGIHFPEVNIKLPTIT